MGLNVAIASFFFFMAFYGYCTTNRMLVIVGLVAGLVASLDVITTIIRNHRHL